MPGRIRNTYRLLTAVVAALVCECVCVCGGGGGGSEAWGALYC